MFIVVWIEAWRSSLIEPGAIGVAERVPTASLRETNEFGDPAKLTLLPRSSERYINGLGWIHPMPLASAFEDPIRHV